jgi:hypothetical protein
MNNNVLRQEEIDILTSFSTPTISVKQQQQPAQSPPQFRQYQTQYPIYYWGSKEPDNWVIRTTIEKWNPTTSQWEYYVHSEKMV